MIVGERLVVEYKRKKKPMMTLHFWFQATRKMELPLISMRKTVSREGGLFLCLAEV